MSKILVKAHSLEDDGEPAVGGLGAVVELVAEVGVAGGAGDFATLEAIDFVLKDVNALIGDGGPEAGPIVALGKAGVGGEEELVAVGATVDAGAGGGGDDGHLLQAVEEGGHFIRFD